VRSLGMRFLGLLVLASSSLAVASAPEPPPLARANPARIAGPFASVDDYCAFRERGVERDEPIAAAPCERDEADPEAPRPKAIVGQAIRDYALVRTEREMHVVVQTARGWYGRLIAESGAGDSTTIDGVELTDITNSRDAELLVEVSTEHAPCGCDLLSRTITEKYACTVIDGALRCTDGVVIATDMDLAEVWSWKATLEIERDGRARRSMDHTKDVPWRTLRALDAPFRVTFHR